MDATATAPQETERTRTRKSKSSMDAIVTARVPVEVKEQVNDMLKEIGATPTELINAAYRYMLKHGSLPETDQPIAGGTPRVLTSEQIKVLRSRIEVMSLSAPESWNDKTFEELYDEAMEERYADLA